MQIKRMAKKIAALGIGAAMLGATLGSALAASSLAKYPAPFVVDGVLSDTVIVVGKGADSSDVLGAIDLAAALQAEATTPVEGVLTTTTVSDGVRVEKSGDAFNYGDDVNGIQESYDDSDLDFLGDTEFEDEDVSQTLAFDTTGTAKLVYASPGKVDKTEFDAGNYMYFPSGTQVYTYTYSLDSTLNYDEAADLETKTLEIQGNTYTITDVKSSSTTGQWTELILQAGETTRWLESDEPLTVGDDTVTVVSVNEAETVCVINVNGVSTSVDVGDTETISGLKVGVTKAFASHSTDADACEVNVGAQEIKLVNNDPVNVNGADIEGSSVVLTGNETAGTFGGFTVTYAMDKDDFEEDMYGPAQYHEAGKSWTDPVFGNFKVMFEGVSSVSEEITFEGGTDDGMLTFNNAKGDEVPVDLYLDGSNVVHFGEETGPLMFAAGTTSYDLDTYPDTKVWFVLSNGEVHLLEWDDYDDDNMKLEFVDLSDREKTVTTTALGAEDGTQYDVSVGTLGTGRFGYNAATNVLTFNNTGGYSAETEYGMLIDLSEGGNMAVVTFTSPDADSDVQVAANVFQANFTYDSSDEELDIDAPVVVSGAAFHANGVDKEYSDSDVKMYVSAKGIMMEHDDEEDTYLYVSYPEEDAYADVFIAPTAASASSSGADGAGVEVNPFSVGLAVLDEDAAGMTKNMIIVGGPCANDLAFEVMGSPENCAEGFDTGRAMLKFFERKGKAALLVAGAEAQDTVRASYVLAQHNGKYKSKFATLGSEVELVVTDMEDVLFTTA